MGRKRWKEVGYKNNLSLAVSLSEETEADQFAALLMASRGIDTPEKINAFMNAETLDFSSPFLILDMDIAVSRISSAIENDEKILVYGDYDCDGVTATAVLYGYLSSIGADADYFIPSRIDDGYGLSMKTAENIVKKGYDLVITVDNGISSIAEAKYLKENGTDLIVTDHHTVGDEIPDCVAVVNPHRPDDNSPEENFAGCGVAFKLVAALEGGDFELISDEFLDIVAIGTIADIVPLTGENRTIVKRGLRLLEETQRPGLIKLMEKAGLSGKQLRSTDIAFYLAPKINAAGRIHTADLALDLIMCEDDETAQILADRLLEANTTRQGIETEMLERIENSFDEDPSHRRDKIMVACGDGFHPGVLGIAASRLVDKYCRPAFVITTDGTGIAKGSARSVEGFPLYEALSAVSDILVRFGGHKQAAGFALRDEDIELFRRKINEYARGFDEVFPSITIDCRLKPEKLTLDILDSLDCLQPFGADNPEPVFGLYDMRIAAIRATSENRHIRLTLTNSRASVQAMYFGMSTDRFPFSAGDNVDVAIRVELNEFRGSRTLAVQIKDIRSAGVNEDGLFASLSGYYNFCSGLEDAKTKNMLCPDRLFVTSVYRFLRENKSFSFSPEILCMKMGVDASCAGKAQVCLDALTEMSLLSFDGEKYTLSAVNGKVDLTDSVILQKLGYRQ